MSLSLRSVVRPLRNNEIAWRYGFNIVPSLNYGIRRRTTLSDAEKSILSRLNRDGVSLSNVDGLLQDPSSFDSIISGTDALLENRRSEIEHLRSRARDVMDVGEKTFNTELLGNSPPADPSDPFCRFALDPTILNIANAYLRMYARLRYYNVWYTFSSNTVARESQLWHFDREDNYILKVFVYLRDVSEGAGPFTYAPETHRKGALQHRRPQTFSENGVRRSTDDQMAAVVPREKWVKATGRKGTIIFADTRGYHKGGEARSDDRLMFTCMFTSPASDSRELLRFDVESDLSNLNAAQKRAIRPRD